MSKVVWWLLASDSGGPLRAVSDYPTARMAQRGQRLCAASAGGNGRVVYTVHRVVGDISAYIELADKLGATLARVAGAHDEPMTEGPEAHE